MGLVNHVGSLLNLGVGRAEQALLFGDDEPLRVDLVRQNDQQAPEQSGQQADGVEGDVFHIAFILLSFVHRRALRVVQ